MINHKPSLFGRGGTKPGTTPWKEVIKADRLSKVNAHKGAQTSLEQEIRRVIRRAIIPLNTFKHLDNILLVFDLWFVLSIGLFWGFFFN